MQKEFADLKGVAIGYVSMDKDPVKARKWMAESFGDNSPMIADLYTDASFAIADKLGVDSFPMTVLVDKSGKIVKIQRGFKEGQGSTKIMADLAKSL